MLRKLSLTTQFALVFLIALALVAAASWLILDRIYMNQLKSQAETVADNVDAFGNWVAQYGLKRLPDATQQISLGKPGELMTAKINPRSRNELDQLALATKRLRVSINMAIERLTKRSS